ncbi:MAG: hypothetical protein ACOZQL_39470 [Myxococcota bacterium]
MKTLRSTLLTAALTVLAACQQPATGPKYQGEPLFSVKGEMSLTGAGTAPSGPIRLAIGWYPDDRSSSAPRALVTQEVQYQGSFPLNYTFSFYGVPPAGALSDYGANGVTTRAAFGVLLAYEDLNGNGELDSIAPGGSPVDRVLGSSLGDVYNGDALADPVYVAYVDGQPPASWAGYSAGYNLQRGGVIVPATTPVPIPLQQTNELNFLVCEEFISGSSYGFDLPCNIAPTDGVRVIGNVYRADGVGGVSLRITDGTAALAGAQVEVNGVAIPFSAAEGLFTASGVPVNAPGRNTVRVVANGQPARLFEMDAPADFAIQAPLEGARLLAGSPLAVEWTRAAGASFYQAAANRVTPPYAGPDAQLVSDRGQTQLGATLGGLDQDDYYQLQVVAFAPGYLAHGRGGSMVNVSTMRTTYVDVLPVNAGLRLEGSVTHVTFQGTTSGSAWVSAFDGLTELDTATLSLNGDALSWDATYRMFGLDTANVQPGQAATFSLAGNGKPAVQVSARLPADFQVGALPAQQPSTQPLALSWAASADATSYRVWVVDAQGRQLHFESLLGTSATLPALGVTGDVYVSIAAAKEDAGERHLLGLVQKTFELRLTP